MEVEVAFVVVEVLVLVVVVEVLLFVVVVDVLLFVVVVSVVGVEVVEGVFEALEVVVGTDVVVVVKIGVVVVRVGVAVTVTVGVSVTFRSDTRQSLNSKMIPPSPALPVSWMATLKGQRSPEALKFQSLVDPSG